MQHEDNATPRYRSGTAARMARMPVSTLRVWEQRYGVISPAKSETGQRLYSGEDVRRLALLRTLVNRGHAIGTIARISSAELEQLLEASQASEEPGPPVAGHAAISLAVCGSLLAERVRRRKTTLASLGVDAVSELPALDGHVPPAVPAGTDVLIVDAASLQPDTAQAILVAARSTGTRAVGVIYSFGTVRATDMLRAAGVRLYRDPNAQAELDQILNELTQLVRVDVVYGKLEPLRRNARRFTDRQLDIFANASQTIACECPRHLVDLIRQLDAFERFSDGCAVRSTLDEQLHRHLGDVANRARLMLEDAMEFAIRAESMHPPAT
ncbi:MerR family transcriptional regulator [Ralstonia mannitolilytica]|uniref:MerR family transcriptional regulator n=1 Tax=Ralstonia mannitolilytica TaxID=105219 RepID=UPI00292E3705|nr:MerR family transcriptional regulator [Ralstonia mannitolilytica]